MALRKYIPLLSGLFLAVLLLDGVATYRNLQKWSGDNQWVVHTQKVLIEIGEFRSLYRFVLNRFQTYLITGEKKYLSDFEEFRSQRRIKLDSAKALTIDNPNQQKRLAEIQALTLAQDSVYDEAIRTLKKGKPKQSEKIKWSVQLNQMADQIRALAIEMTGEESRLLSTRSDESDSTFRQTLWIFILSMLGTLLLFAAVLGLTLRGMKVSDRLSRIEEEKSDKARLLDSVLETMSEGIVVANHAGKMIYFNGAAERIIGRGISENNSSEWTKEYGVFREDRVTPFREEELPLYRVARGEAVNGVIQFLRNEGHPDGIFISVNGNPIRNSDGGIEGGLVVIRDISESRRLEEITRTQDFITSVLENLPNMVFVKEAKELRFVMFNKAGEDLTGFSRQDLVGKNDYDFFPKEDAEFFTSKDRKVLEEGKLLDIPEETLRSREKGPRILHTKKIPIFDKSGKAQYLLGISEDITDRKNQEEREVYTRALEVSNREMQDFVFVASHDLQEPLRKIQSFGQFLQDEFKETLGETGRDYVERMQSAAKRMQILINDLLTLTRVTTKAQPFVPVDFNEILKGVLSDLETRIAESRGKVEISPLPILKGDATQIRQLFQNLLGNGLKFRKPDVPPLIKVSAVNLGGAVRIKVEDNGIGFDNKYAEQIFKVFERLHGRGEFEGTGIGLAICKKVVERHGGSIRAEGRLGEGSVFTIEIPVG